jgi:ParB family transcriptional regulator, chromosome partitioning protein
MATLSIVKNPDKQALSNSGTKPAAKMVKLDSISTAEPFKTLFKINPAVLSAIAMDILQSGYDSSQPLHIWKEKGILIDGHTRLEAAKQADLFTVPVFEHSFVNEAAALEYAIHMQRDRRNLTDAELYACIVELDKRGTHGGARFKCAPEHLNDSRAKTAEVVGTSKDKVQKVRTISDHAPADIKAQLRTGDLSINQAYAKTQASRKAKPSSSDGSTPLPPSASSVGSASLFSILDEIGTKNRIVIKLSDTLPADTVTGLLAAIESSLASVLEKRARPTVAAGS